MARIGAITIDRHPNQANCSEDAVKDFRQIEMNKSIYATGWDRSIDINATAGGVYHVTIESPTAPASCG